MFKTINGGKLPTRGSKYSACVDLYANADATIGAGETVLIPLGVCIDRRLLNNAIEKDLMNMSGGQLDLLSAGVEADVTIESFKNSHYLQLMLRSSLSKHLIIANGVGVIDMDYKDEIMIRVHNPFTYDSFHNLKAGLLHGKDNPDVVKVSGLIKEMVDKQSRIIKKGDRVAQITLLEHKGYLFGIESEDERNGGFGSSGTR